MSDETGEWQRAAMQETVQRVVRASRSRWEHIKLIDHIKGMPERMEADFSDAKIGRWLGWVQGVACAMGWLSLDECKQINKAASDAATPSKAETPA